MCTCVTVCVSEFVCVPVRPDRLSYLLVWPHVSLYVWVSLCVCACETRSLKLSLGVTTCVTVCVSVSVCVPVRPDRLSYLLVWPHVSLCVWVSLCVCACETRLLKLSLGVTAVILCVAHMHLESNWHLCVLSGPQWGKFRHWSDQILITNHVLFLLHLMSHYYCTAKDFCLHENHMSIIIWYMRYPQLMVTDNRNLYLNFKIIFKITSSIGKNWAESEA